MYLAVQMNEADVMKDSGDWSLICGAAPTQTPLPLRTPAVTTNIITLGVDSSCLTPRFTHCITKQQLHRN